MLVIGLPEIAEWRVEAVRLSTAGQPDRPDDAMLAELDVETLQQYGPLEDGLEDAALSVNHIEEYFTPTQLREAARPGKPAADAPSASVPPAGQAPPRAGLTQLGASATTSTAAHQRAHAKATIASAAKQAAHQATKATSPAEDIRAFVAKQKANSITPKKMLSKALIKKPKQSQAKIEP